MAPRRRPPCGSGCRRPTGELRVAGHEEHLRRRGPDDLRPGHVLVSLVELDPALADRGLYAAQGAPTVGIDDLDPGALQAAGPGRLGAQRFFSLHGRAFSLYVMAREGPRLERALHAMNASLRSLAVGVA